ncbi:threonyl-tRNA synthetase [Zopfia rhizophila CBS 207.26]|uniref:threonine--tRNA ligase n=1 Tax=Zopfia rhizophila CBS 207.26 TaxID=1314779 RepID=A0A6A6DI80_9PEZI|nr:threonyl-tRNA synthetase [Zopfia rhizophila CBS 207.26]
MPPMRAPLSLTNVLRYTQLTSRYTRQHGQTFIRSCSCSAPERSPTTANLLVERGELPDPPTPSTDHRTLAQSHNLFITSPYSPGSPLLLPNGAYIFQKLQSFLRAQYPQFGFQEVITPTIYKKSLWETSGHWENYAEDMFSVQGRGATGQTQKAEVGQDEEFGLKPMNCPGHCLLFKSDVKSYRDLPIRFADFSALHRNEISGALTGLTRVRRFHQDDAHIFCRPDQILEEIEQTLRFVGMVYDTFGLGPYKLLLSTRPTDHFIGTIEEWDRAEAQLATALNNSGREWAINSGDGAFYGPKIDIILKDSHGKEHQTATIQLDFQLPQRFDLSYQASPEELESQSKPQMQNSSSGIDQGLDKGCKRPVIIHRAIYGSLERFMALLIEHYAGAYPFWVSPRPAIILSVNQDPAVLSHISYTQATLSGLPFQNPDPDSDSDSPSNWHPTPQSLNKIYVPIDIDTSARPLGKKIQEARQKKYNHIVVIGPKDVESKGMRIEIAATPDVESAMRVLQDTVLGRGVKGKSVECSAHEGRMYFEELMKGYM